MRFLLAVVLCASAHAADVATEIGNIEKAVWAPDAHYLKLCVRLQGTDPIGATLFFLGQPEYFSGLVDRFPNVAKSVENVLVSARANAWTNLKVERLDELTHYSALDNERVWLGPFKAVACHFSAAGPHLTTPLQPAIKDIVEREKKLAELYKKFKDGGQEDGLIYFEMYSEYARASWDAAEALIARTEGNVLVGYRSHAQRALMQFHRGLLNANSTNRF